MGNRRRGQHDQFRWLAEPAFADFGRDTDPFARFPSAKVLPRILRGKAPAFALRGISDLTLPKRCQRRRCPDVRRDRARLLHAAREIIPAPHRIFSTKPPDDARRHQAHQAEARAGLRHSRSSIRTPNFGRKLEQVARVIKADVGLEVAEVDYGGWDSHQNQGGADGTYANLVKDFAEGLAAFAKDLGDRLDDTLVLTMSDFGRTAAENGTRGTDHGWANCMMAMGGKLVTASPGGIVKPVLSQWPGLDKDKLHQGRDLLHTTDFRDVLGEVVSVHLGNQQIKTVLPSHDFKSVGFIRA